MYKLLFALATGTEERGKYQQAIVELEVLQKRFQCASSSDAKASAIVLIKDQMQQFIEKSLDAGLPIKKVKSEINDLCFKAAVVPSILLDWVKDEFEEKSLKWSEKNCEVHSNEGVCAKFQTYDHEPQLFSKDTLYHAGLCCEAVSSWRRATDVKMYFHTKSPMHSLEEISVSESSEVTPFLIAKQNKTIYVAFQSEPLISKLKETGYDES